MQDLIETKPTGPTPLNELSLADLWSEAEVYGAVRVYSNIKEKPPACYRVTIEFRTMDGMNLEASSEFNMPLGAALVMAIERARKIAPDEETQP